MLSWDDVAHLQLCYLLNIHDPNSNMYELMACEGVFFLFFGLVHISLRLTYSIKLVLLLL